MDTARRRFGGARACGARYFLNSRLAGGSRRGAVDRWMGRVGVVPAASAALPAAPAPALEWVEPAEASFEGPNGPSAVLSHPRPGAMREIHERGTDHELSRDVLAPGGRAGRRVLLVVIEEAALERPRALLHLLHLPRGLSPPEPRHGWPRVRLHLPDAAPGLEGARPFRATSIHAGKRRPAGDVPNPIRISMTRYLSDGAYLWLITFRIIFCFWETAQLQQLVQRPHVPLAHVRQRLHRQHAERLLDLNPNLVQTHRQVRQRKHRGYRGPVKRLPQREWQRQEPYHQRPRRVPGVRQRNRRADDPLGSAADLPNLRHHLLALAVYHVRHPGFQRLAQLLASLRVHDHGEVVAGARQVNHPRRLLLAHDPDQVAARVHLERGRVVGVHPGATLAHVRLDGVPCTQNTRDVRY